MPVYDRAAAEGYREIDRWERGVGWIAHPDEAGRRASHAVATDEGTWLLDPVDAPGIDELVTALGPVAGVAVCADYHARDAGRIARRHGVPVSVPAPLDRAADRVDAPVERVEGSVAGFDLHRLRPLGLWRETTLVRESDGTLYVPDFLTAVESATVGEERVSMPTFSRLRAPHDPFPELDPERILFGHGEGVFEDAAGALRSSHEGARRRFPRALVATLPTELRMMLGALR